MNRTYPLLLATQLQQVEALTLAASSVTQTRAMGAATVGSFIPLTASSVVHTRGIGAANVNVVLTPTSITHTRGLGSHVVMEVSVGGGDAATTATDNSFLTLVGF